MLRKKRICPNVRADIITSLFILWAALAPSQLCTTCRLDGKLTLHVGRRQKQWISLLQKFHSYEILLYISSDCSAWQYVKELCTISLRLNSWGPGLINGSTKPKSTTQPLTAELVKQSPRSTEVDAQRVSCRHQQNHSGVQTSSMYQLKEAQGTLKVGTSIPPLSTSTLISHLLIQKAARAPSSSAMRTPEPEKFPLKKRGPTCQIWVSTCWLQIY